MLISIALYYLEGDDRLAAFSDYRFAYSAITKIELLGWHNIKEHEVKQIRSFLSICELIEITSDIRAIAFELRQKNRIKTPDAIVAATALYLKLPLLSADKGFEKISNLDLVLIE